MIEGNSSPHMPEQRAYEVHWSVLQKLNVGRYDRP